MTDITIEPRRPKGVEDKDSSQIGERDLNDGENYGYVPELQRRFGKWQMVGFSCTIMITWEGLLFVFTYGLENGGPAGLIYGFLFCWVGYLAVTLSLAELVSMTPTAAGQYHWTWTLAPPRYRKFLSYITGFQLVLAWQADIASAAYLASEVILGLVSLNTPSYVSTGWHVTLVLYATMLLALLFNTVLMRFLPSIEWVILLIHLGGFLVVAVPLAYYAEHSSPTEVFTNLLTLGGYSPGTSFFVGLITTVFAFLGADGAIHMSEEVEDARLNVPSSLAWSLGINGSLGFAMLLVMLFSMGNIDNALNSPTGFPFMEIFQQALPDSVVFTTALSSLLLVLLLSAVIAVTAAASRVTWAFARDNGLPGSRFLKKIDKRSGLPGWSIGLSVLITLLLGLINVGSATAFNAVLSLMVAAYLGSYIVPISLIAWKRWTKQELELGPWNLGRYGLVVNLTAIVWSLITFVFSFWPTSATPTLQTMNWSVVLWFGTMFIGCLLYIRQRRIFRGPLMIRNEATAFMD